MAQLITGAGAYTPLVARPILPTRTFSSLPARTVSPTGAGPAPTPAAPVIRPVGPITAPLPPPPISPISGNPIVTSIFQPTHTTSTIVDPAVTADSAPVTGLDLISPPAPGVGAVSFGGGVALGDTSVSFNISSDMWLVLLLVLAAVIVMVIA